MPYQLNTFYGSLMKAEQRMIKGYLSVSYLLCEFSQPATRFFRTDILQYVSSGAPNIPSHRETVSVKLAQ